MRTSDGREQRSADSRGLQTTDEERRTSLVHHKVALFLQNCLKEKFEMKGNTVK